MAQAFLFLTDLISNYTEIGYLGHLGPVGPVRPEHGPETEGLERSRRARWKHRRYSRETRAVLAESRRQWKEVWALLGRPVSGEKKTAMCGKICDRHVFEQKKPRP